MGAVRVGKAGRLPAWIVAVALAMGALVAVAGAPPAAAHNAEAGTFTSLSPVRLLDTRNGLGAAKRQIAAGGTVTFQVAGKAGVPFTDVGAAVLNVTVTGASAPGYVVAYPAGTSAPNSSSVNFVAGRTVANAVTVKVSADGQVTLRNGSTRPVDILADVAGWYAGGTVATPGALSAVDPRRILDTRNAIGAPRASVPAQGEVEFTVTGGNVPTSAAAVVLNVTVTGARAPGYVVAYPTGTAAPGASSVNFVGGQTTANAVTVKVGANGKVTLRNGSTQQVDLIADIGGWFSGSTPTAAGAFTAVQPSRLLDTRRTAAIPAGGSIPLNLTGSVPAAAAAVALNVTATQAAAGGFVTVHPGGTARPNASNINLIAGRTIANQVTVRLASNGTIALSNGSTRPVHVIVDLNGWYAAEAAPQPDVRFSVRYVGGAPAFTVNGVGFRAVTNPGDNGVYAGLAPSGGIPDLDQEEGIAYFAGANWVMPNQIVNTAFTTSFVADPDKLDPTVQYSLYTWQAHTHSNASQDTETPVTIDWSQVDTD